MQDSYQVPTKLYHATYSQFLASIMTNGLGNTTNKMWTDSKTGVVYLAKDPWEAESYAEESEWLDDKEDVYEYLDNIVILEIDTDKLDVNNLYRDENLLPGGNEVIGFEYHGIIPWEACKVFESTINEELSKYRVNWTIIDRDDSRRDKSIEVMAASEQAAKAMVPDKKALNIWVTKLEALESDFANAFKLYEKLWDFLDESLLEAKTGIPYKGYIICYGCHDTDRWYVKDSYDKFLGTKSGYSCEEEAREFIDTLED